MGGLSLFPDPNLKESDRQTGAIFWNFCYMVTIYCMKTSLFRYLLYGDNMLYENKILLENVILCEDKMSSMKGIDSPSKPPDSILQFSGNCVIK